MGTAFITSIWGMGLSLVFTFIFKIWHHKVNKIIQVLCVKLDNQYKIKHADLQNYDQAQQKDTINEVLNQYQEKQKEIINNIFKEYP